MPTGNNHREGAAPRTIHENLQNTLGENPAETHTKLVWRTVTLLGDAKENLSRWRDTLSFDEESEPGKHHCCVPHSSPCVQQAPKPRPALTWRRTRRSRASPPARRSSGDWPRSVAARLQAGRTRGATASVWSRLPGGQIARGFLSRKQINSVGRRHGCKDADTKINNG